MAGRGIKDSDGNLGFNSNHRGKFIFIHTYGLCCFHSNRSFCQKKGGIKSGYTSDKLHFLVFLSFTVFSVSVNNSLSLFLSSLISLPRSKITHTSAILSQTAHLETCLPSDQTPLILCSFCFALFTADWIIKTLLVSPGFYGQP